MPTRLSNFCDKIIEAGWLVTLAVVPLFFNPYLEIPGYVYEVSKTFVLRSVILVMLLAWLVKKTETGGLRFNFKEYFRQFPVALPACLLAVIFFISSVFSISPRLSFGGLYLREESFFSFISYILFFLLLIDGLKTEEQLNRILNTIILVSFPVGLYGIFQHFGWDPVKYSGGSTRDRVTSTFGGPIFAAGYLMMAMPLTVYFSIKSFAEKKLFSYLQGAVYILILAVQTACFIFAWSRGPLIGLAVALIFLLLLVITVTKKKWLFGAIVGIIIAGGIFFVLVNLPDSPFPGLKKSFGRFGNIFQESQTGSGKVRLLTWDSALAIIGSSPARLPFGHGLESLFYLYYRYTHPSFARFENSLAIPDHSHNETLDLLITGGILSLLAFLSVIIIGSYAALKSLGLINNRRQVKIFLLILLLSLSGAVFIPFLIKDASNLIGITIPFSIIFGIFIYLCSFIIRHNPLSPPLLRGKGASDTKPTGFLTRLSGDGLLLIALFSGLIGHFAEIQFLFGLTATRLHFWTYLALITVVGTISFKQPNQFHQPANKKTEAAPLSAYLKRLFLYSVLTGLILSVLLFELAKGKYPDKITDFNYLLIISAWLFAGILATIFALRQAQGGEPFGKLRGEHAESPSRTGGRDTRKPFVWHFNFYLLSLVISGCWAGLALMIHNRLIADQINLANPPRLTELLFVWFGINIVMAASCLAGPAKNISASSNLLLKIPFYLFSFFLILAAIYHLNLRKIYADAYYHLADEYQSAGRWDKSIEEFRRALELAPHTNVYCQNISQSYEKKKDWPAAEKHLKQAQTANPFTPEPLMNLAALYQRWAESAPAERVQKLDLVIKAYEEIIRMAPLRPHIFKDWGNIYILKKDYEAAANKYRQALALDESDDLYFSLGYTYYLLNKTDEAIASYEKAGRWNIPRAYDALAKLAQEYFGKGSYDASVKANLILIKFKPDSYISYHNAASGYERLNQPETALEYARKALELAPPEKKPAVEDLKKNIESKLKPK